MLDQEEHKDLASWKNSGSPRVTIGMPVHNGGKFLREALDALLAQTFEEFELVISDNASTDETLIICREYAGNDSRIRYSRLESSIEGVENFNRTLSLATGEYFMWAAYDDKWEPTFIRSMVQALDDNPKAVLAFCQFNLIDEFGREVQTNRTDWQRIFMRSKLSQVAFMALKDELDSRKANHIYGLMRRSTLIECGGMMFHPQMSYAGEDVLTLLCLLAKGEFTIRDELLFHYRLKPQPLRRDERLAGYIWQRITRQMAGHQGSLMLFFLRNHSYHSNMRKLIMKQGSFNLIARMLLYAALIVKEVWFPIKFLPLAVLRELRVVR